MSTYETLTLLILFGTFLIALLAYIDRKQAKINKLALLLDRYRQAY